LFRDPAFWDAGWVREHLTPRLMRRLAASGTRAELVACATLLSLAPGPADRAALMAGFEEAMRGRSLPGLPEELGRALESSGLLTPVLRARRGDAEALRDMIRQAGDAAASAEQRIAAIRLLGEVRPADAAEVLLGVVRSEAAVAVRTAACAALSGYDGEGLGTALAAALPGFPVAVRDAAVNLLASRAAWSRALVAAVSTGRLPRGAVPVEVRARMGRHGDPTIEAWLARQPAVAPAGSSVWRPRIEAVRKVITATPGDPYRGEPLFMDRCGGCHTLFFKGGKIGPDLTSYQRDDLGTMLISIIDPNAEIREGYENHLVTTKDGRTLGGFLADQDARVIVLRGYEGTDLTLARSEVASLDPAGRSLMPEGLLEEYSDQEIRDLFAYLRQSQPIVR
ncbi:MAG: c-type cytochrome, partial [Verrucomicrobiales bacterium]|nr:c-type cytochrome [Verrucomicrobiales bacterium]